MDNRNKFLKVPLAIASVQNIGLPNKLLQAIA
jgi:hypothetical protein